CQEGYGYPYIF
nr:immunoglobulin light chain junction region [Macaca mulatta]